MKSLLSLAIWGCFLGMVKGEEFVRVIGKDVSFAEVMKSGKLPRGVNSTKGFQGSKVEVNQRLLKEVPTGKRDFEKAIKLHTLGHSSLPRRSFGNWTRWYQESGKTQVFRLFPGEENVRNSRKLAARVEVFSELSWKRGAWQEWEGTYTIIKPHGAAIFQAKNNVNDWSVVLNMNGKGDVKLNHRRGKDVTLARGMVGKPFHVRVRDNGHDYEVYYEGKLAGEGSYARPTGETSFRWGLYLGGTEAKSEMMVLVTGATITPSRR